MNNPSQFLKKAKGEELFFSWYQQSAQFLWEFLHFFAPHSGEYLDDIVGVLQKERIRISKAMKQGRSLDFSTSLFLKSWFKKNKISPARNKIENFELSWEEKFAVFALIKKGFSLSRVAFLMGQSPDSMRFLVFNALAKRANVAEIETRCGERDCIRNDLYFVDSLLKLPITDPLGLIDWKQVEKHSLNCSRCYHLVEKLKIEADRIKQAPTKKMPDEFGTFVVGELGNHWKKLVSGEWFGGLSLWLKVPLQLAIVVVIVSLVLSSGKLEEFVDFSKLQKVAVLKVEEIKQWVQLKSGEKSTSVDQSTIVTKVSESIKQEPKVIESEVKSLKKYISKLLIVPPASPKAIIEASVEATKIPVEPKVVPTKIDKLEKSVQVEKTEKFFYRWGAYAKDLETETPNILAVLNQFQVLRSGELALGAEYKGGKYFHFSISKNDFPKLLEEMKKQNMVAFSSTRAISDKEISVERNRVVFLLLPVHAENKKSVDVSSPTSEPHP